ncbi:MAG: signal peptidase I [Clostridiales bacterium]|nr:signal peptidase I [Clostridiales bacterium]HOA85584.1 signal peptidase I [Bacillota bacterium]
MEINNEGGGSVNPESPGTQVPESTPNLKKKTSFASELFDYVEIFVYSVCAVILVFTFIIRLCSVDGPSMEQTLHDKEILLVSNLNYKPAQGDIIVFHLTGSPDPNLNKPIVKRVIATAGKYVRIDYDAGLVYVSDDYVFDESDILDESGYIYLSNGRWNRSGVYETYVPEGYLFVMGDNRNNSLDSRESAIGLLDQRRVFGKVLLRLFPLSKAGSVYK